MGILKAKTYSSDIRALIFSSGIDRAQTRLCSLGLGNAGAIFVQANLSFSRRSLILSRGIKPARESAAFLSILRGVRARIPRDDTLATDFPRNGEKGREEIPPTQATFLRETWDAFLLARKEVNASFRVSSPLFHRREREREKERAERSR